ncbi:hypothetical protein PoB_000094500 [Plakobranchus ocellatus]|uniref:G-protein coupled receptors family 1 profile domain-containing protein n=1 Tax=Plakobranchus ocellatus TaxID=259542 RepID=A0AAV3XVL1_9GAST|nr:hypothetical protein PoB_000094500 [Plakobranchus ocellatus]
MNATTQSDTEHLQDVQLLSDELYMYIRLLLWSLILILSLNAVIVNILNILTFYTIGLVDSVSACFFCLSVADELLHCIVLDNQPSRALGGALQLSNVPLALYINRYLGSHHGLHSYSESCLCCISIFCTEFLHQEQITSGNKCLSCNHSGLHPALCSFHASNRGSRPANKL